GAVPPALTCERIHNGTADHSGYVTIEGVPLHRMVSPLSGVDGTVRGHLVVVQNPYSYAARRGVLTKKYAFLGFSILVLLIALVTVLVHQWSVSQRLDQFSRGMKGLIKGDL